MSRATAGSIPDVTGRREPLWDRWLIDRLDGCGLRAFQPASVERVFGFHPEDGVWCYAPTVLQANGHWRMYVRVRHDWMHDIYRAAVLLLTSDDGLSWNRHGLVMPVSSDGFVFRPFVDDAPGVPPDERFKAVAAEPGTPQQVAARWRVWLSGDGIHWRSNERTHSIQAPLPGVMGCQPSCWWSPRTRTYHMVSRAWLGCGWTSTAEGSDPWNWGPWYPATVGDRPLEHHQDVLAAPYIRAPQVIAGMGLRPLTADGRVPDGHTDSEATRRPVGGPEARCDVTLWVGREGASHFERLDPPLLSPERGAVAVGSPDLVPQPDGRLCWYVVQRFGCAGTALYRYTWPPDALAGLEADIGGIAQTRLIRFHGGAVRVNTQLRPRGAIRAEWQEADGRAVTGFTVRDCRPISGSAPDAEIHWRRPVTALPDRPLRLRIYLSRGRAHALEFRT